MNWYRKSEYMFSSKIIILTKLQNYDYTNNKQKGLCSSSMKNYKMYRIFCLPSPFPIDCSFMQPSQENSCWTQNTPRVSIFKTRGGGISENYSPPTIHQPTTGPDSFQNNLASFIYCKSREWKWLDTQLKVFYGEKCLIYTAVGKIIVFRIFGSIYLQYCHKSVISLIMIQPQF